MSRYSIEHCGLCGSSNRKLSIEGPDRQMSIHGTFTMVRCLDCGVFYQYPRPSWEQVEPHYVGEYTSYPVTNKNSGFAKWVRRLGSRKQCRAVEKYCRSGNLLDVGSGAGLFLSEMKSKKWHVQGLEPTKHVAEYVESQLKIPVIRNTWEEATIPSHSLDVITMWNVFEHLEDPIQALQKVYTSLKPGGYAVIALPMYESISRILFGRYWVGWDLPRHLYVFSNSTIKNVFQKNGFIIVNDVCFLSSYSIFFDSLSYYFNEIKINKKTQDMIRNIYFSYPIRVLLYPIFRIAEIIKVTTVKTWIIQKPK